MRYETSLKLRLWMVALICTVAVIWANFWQSNFGIWGLTIVAATTIFSVSMHYYKKAVGGAA